MGAQFDLPDGEVRRLRRDIEALVERLDRAATRSALTPPRLSILDAAQHMYAMRRRREQLFGRDLICDASWDILLALLIAQLEGRTLSISAACAAAHAPATTVLRHLERLTSDGLVRREANPADARSRHLVLTEEAEQKLNEYFGECTLC